MAPSQHRPGSADSSDEESDDRMPPVPDQDGPHDVPDEQVIEKTIPSRPRHGGDEHGTG